MPAHTCTHGEYDCSLCTFSDLLLVREAREGWEESCSVEEKPEQDGEVSWGAYLIQGRCPKVSLIKSILEASSLSHLVKPRLLLEK